MNRSTELIILNFLIDKEKSFGIPFLLRKFMKREKSFVNVGYETYFLFMVFESSLFPIYGILE